MSEPKVVVRTLLIVGVFVVFQILTIGFLAAQTASDSSKAGENSLPYRLLVPGKTLFIVSTNGTAPAVVDGKQISWTSYNATLAQSARTKFYHLQVPASEEAILREKVIEEMILDQLLEKEMENRKISANETAVQAELDKIDNRYKDSKVWKEQREKVLTKLRVELEKQSKRKKLEATIRRVEEQTEAQLHEFYNANPIVFTEPVKEHISVILLKVDPSSSALDWKKAEDEADKIRKKIGNGSDFASIAKLRSDDESAAKGGDMGYIHKGMIADDAQKAVDEMKPGEVSEPIRLLQGYALFKLHDLKVERKLSFKDARSRISSLYRRITSDNQWENFKKEIRQNADVTINPILAAPAHSNNG